MPNAVEEVAGLESILLPEFEQYGELIAATDHSLAGLLLRGEGSGFTDRIQGLLRQWDLGDEAAFVQARVAGAFEHKRCFLKLEWCGHATGVDRQAAVYYRRRPKLHEALKIVAQSAGTTVALDDLRELGALLGKDTVHFVSAVMRPGRPIHYKLYFSQYVTPASHEQVFGRLQRAMRRFAGQPSAEGRWATYHDRLSSRQLAHTLFVSLAVSEDGTDPSLKVDYPGVAPVVAAGLLDGARLRQTEARLRHLCEAAGRTELSYLGVRIRAEGDPVLKGYADFV
ncbi:MAG: hypothetical protein NTNFB01_21460 [Nitrospira sp.]|jgi:hypothetical protein